MSFGSEGPARRASEKREQVRRHVVRLIDEAAPGFAKASERDLAAELGVARSTVRATIEELVEEGLVTRQHGRGTFSSPDQAAGPPDTAKKFDETGWSSSVLAFKRPFARPSWTARLGLPVGAPVLTVVRVLEERGEPIAIEHLALPEDLLPGLIPADLAVRDLRPLLRERFGIVVRTARETLEPGNADAEQAKLLAVDVHSPVLLAERLACDTRGRVVALSETVYRGDRQPAG
ncbi:GntR family transcriptional regulator [Amycolatopsis japonica]|uniref:GntR family transcriptional regulator n=1 Tax=Amycolatopsis japonica TaxID=208439 RepID=UPI0036722552